MSSSFTPHGSVLMGTPDYLAPEQALNFHGADIRADIYSLGCTFFYLLTGEPPFPSGNLTEKLLRHQQADLPDLNQFRSDVPPQVAALIQEMLAKTPENRCQTPAEVVATLAQLVPIAREVVPVAAPNRRRWLAAAGGVLALAGLTGWKLLPRRPASSVNDPQAGKLTKAPDRTEPLPLDRLPLVTITTGSMTVNGRQGPLRAIAWRLCPRRTLPPLPFVRHPTWSRWQPVRGLFCSGTSLPERSGRCRVTTRALPAWASLPTDGHLPREVPMITWSKSGT